MVTLCINVPHRRHCVASIWPVLIHLVMWHCRVVLVVLGHSMVGWLTRVRRLGLLVLVVIAASDVGPRCHWRGWCWVLVAVGGWCVVMVALLSRCVVSSCRCCGMVIICCGCGCGQSSLSSVVAANVVFLHHSDGVPACPGQVVVGGGQWCGNNGWVL